MTSQPCPPSALSPLPTTQQTRVEIPPPSTPFNSKDFVEMTESITRKSRRAQGASVANREPTASVATSSSGNLISHIQRQDTHSRESEKQKSSYRGRFGKQPHISNPQTCPVEAPSPGRHPHTIFPRSQSHLSLRNEQLTAESPMTSYRTANIPLLRAGSNLTIHEKRNGLES